MTPDSLKTWAGDAITVEHRPDPCEPSLFVRGAREACERLTELARAEQLPDLILLTAAYRDLESDNWCVALGIWRA